MSRAGIDADIFDKPNTASSQTYTVGTTGDGTHGAALGSKGDSGVFGTMILEEIMG